MLTHQLTLFLTESHRADPDCLIGLPAILARRLESDERLTVCEERDCSCLLWQSAAELRALRSEFPMEVEEDYSDAN